MELTFVNSTVTGVISAAAAKHKAARVDKTNCEMLGELDITVQKAVNNGVIVHLEPGSVWNVTGTGYLTALTVAEGAVLNGKLTVNGAPVASPSGAYAGDIVVEKN
jgi:hypothetical protein